MNVSNVEKPAMTAEAPPPTCLVCRAGWGPH
jgi:hypothetical protein